MVTFTKHIILYIYRFTHNSLAIFAFARFCNVCCLILNCLRLHILLPLNCNAIFPLSLLALLRVYLEGPVHARAANVVGPLPEPHPGGHSRVLTQHLNYKIESRGYTRYLLWCFVSDQASKKYLEHVPLFAQVDPDIGSRHGEVGAARVEAEVAHLVALVQGQRLEVLQLPQIPQLDAAIVSSSGQIVSWNAAPNILFLVCFLCWSLTILGECHGGNVSSVSGEVGHVALLLQIPDLDFSVASPGAEDQTIRMELETIYFSYIYKFNSRTCLLKGS